MASWASHLPTRRCMIGPELTATHFKKGSWRGLQLDQSDALRPTSTSAAGYATSHCLCTTNSIIRQPMVGRPRDSSESHPPLAKVQGNEPGQVRHMKACTTYITPRDMALSPPSDQFVSDHGIALETNSACARDAMVSIISIQDHQEGDWP